MAQTETFEELKESWAHYKHSIESWLAAVDDSRDEKELDSLVHGVIDSHNVWVQRLGDLIEKTHHH